MRPVPEVKVFSSIHRMISQRRAFTWSPTKGETREIDGRSTSVGQRGVISEEDSIKISAKKVYLNEKSESHHMIILNVPERKVRR